ncbi:MAG: hypothetical protein AB1815_08950 [Bacillota bacterium]
MVDVMDKVQKLTEIGKSIRDKQRVINVNEVFYVWDILVTKLDIMETVQISENFIDDNDLKYIAGILADGLQTGIADMERLLNDYGIPFPVRPPAGNNTAVNIEFIKDKDIYYGLFEGIQALFPILASGFMNSTTPVVRKAFKNHLLLSMEILETIVEYGKLKGFLDTPPVYRP